MAKVRPLIFLLVVTVLAWTGVTVVQAHAMLMRSIPDANASLTSSPAQIELFFSETVAANLSKISVLDQNGKHVDAGASRTDPADATPLVAPLPTLGDGVYTVV